MRMTYNKAICLEACKMLKKFEKELSTKTTECLLNLPHNMKIIDKINFIEIFERNLSILSFLLNQKRLTFFFLQLTFIVMSSYSKK